MSKKFRKLSPHPSAAVIYKVCVCAVATGYPTFVVSIEEKVSHNLEREVGFGFRIKQGHEYIMCFFSLLFFSSFAASPSTPESEEDLPKTAQ